MRPKSYYDRMKEIFIVSPVKTPDSIREFCKKTNCREFYVYHHRFINDNFEYIEEYIKAAHECGARIFVNFKHSIDEEEVSKTKKFIEFLHTTRIDGIFVNSYGILEIIKTMDLPFKVIIDSYFDIHNLCGIEFMEMFHKIDRLIITEELYLKNIEKIKKYAKIPLAIDTDNLPYFADDIIKSRAVSAVVIKGKFQNSDEILNAIKLIEKIPAKPKMFKEQKLPFKHVRKSFYRTNHFSGEIQSAQGGDFKFANNIHKYDWKVKGSAIKKNCDYKSLKLPKMNLRVASLEQLRELEKFIDKIGFNPVNSIEYGEVASTVDLYTKSFDELVNVVKEFCKKHKIKLNLSTPRILIERDFDRVYELIGTLALQTPKPATIVVNNIGMWWAIINDAKLSDVNVEIGGGINLLNSYSIKCLSNLHPIRAIDFSTLGDEENVISCIKKTKRLIPNKKMFIGGAKRVESIGLCPLNCDSAVISRLSCSAPCHRGHWCITDPLIDKTFPIMVDGFCKMHMFEETIVQNFDKIPYYSNLGINEFVIDFSSIHSPLVPKILSNYLNTMQKICILS